MISSNKKCMFYFPEKAKISIVASEEVVEGHIESINEAKVTINALEGGTVSIFPENIQALSVTPAEYTGSWLSLKDPFPPFVFPIDDDDDNDFAYKVSSAKITSISSQSKTYERNSWLAEKTPDGCALYCVPGCVGLKGSHLLVIEIELSKTV